MTTCDHECGDEHHGLWWCVLPEHHPGPHDCRSACGYPRPDHNAEHELADLYEREDHQ